MTTAIAVTDEMVEAAKAAYMKETGAEAYQLDGWIEPALRAALSAALTPHGEEAAATPAPQHHLRGKRWRVFEDTTPGYWGIELEDVGNDDDAVLYPQKIHRDTVARIVEAHNAALDPTDRDPEPGEHQEVLDAISAHNSGEDQ